MLSLKRWLLLFSCALIPVTLIRANLNLSYSFNAKIFDSLKPHFTIGINSMLLLLMAVNKRKSNF